jgi:hypothetical protein
MDVWFPLAGEHPAGSTTLRLLRGQSVQLPQCIQPGVDVAPNWSGGMSPGTQVQSIGQDTIELTTPTTGPVSGVRFADVNGPLGQYDYRYPYYGQGLPGTIRGDTLVPI